MYLNTSMYVYAQIHLSEPAVPIFAVLGFCRACFDPCLSPEALEIPWPPSWNVLGVM